ncbi:hypothetical protein IW261DRAFT_1423527 [Armillaria novae-zelandiae]|uniref:Uncharacterized protein n=1 Tax=Armillaria novae-zelandiae TaxID=153914 RepID=A0AA39T9F1_9AGAR|nr:hypothetical protein IW261DRAFT_1423527 [Armillaria novae-zelandiae]
MRYNLKEEDQLQEVAETTESGDHLSFGMMYMFEGDDPNTVDRSSSGDIPDLELVDDEWVLNEIHHSMPEPLESNATPASGETTLEEGIVESLNNLFGTIGANIITPIPGVENFRQLWTEEDATSVDWNGKPMFSWVNNAKEVFGYLDTDYSNFMIHQRMDPNWVPRSIGDLYQYAAEFCLNHDRPYPGDELCWGVEGSHRFSVFRLSQGTFAIADMESEHVPGMLNSVPGIWYYHMIPMSGI